MWVKAQPRFSERPGFKFCLRLHVTALLSHRLLPVKQRLRTLSIGGRENSVNIFLDSTFYWFDLFVCLCWYHVVSMTTAFTQSWSPVLRPPILFSFKVVSEILSFLNSHLHFRSAFQFLQKSLLVFRVALCWLCGHSNSIVLAPLGENWCLHSIIL